MIAVQTETLVGLIGFGGAVVGAGGALLGGWLQQRHQAETARADRIEERGMTAGANALEELRALWRHMAEVGGQPDRIPDAFQPWKKIANAHMAEATLATMLMPQAEVVRQRIREVGDAMAVLADAVRDESAALLCYSIGADDALDLLTAYMRGDPLPEPSSLVRDYRHNRQSGQIGFHNPATGMVSVRPHDDDDPQ
jgi:hypothetical protein